VRIRITTSKGEDFAINDIDAIRTNTDGIGIVSNNWMSWDVIPRDRDIEIEYSEVSSSPGEQLDIPTV
jgi:hypothetical protein